VTVIFNFMFFGADETHSSLNRPCCAGAPSTNCARSTPWPVVMLGAMVVPLLREEPLGTERLRMLINP
jgi:hypothetical protein